MEGGKWVVEGRKRGMGPGSGVLIRQEREPEGQENE